ncbi:tetratricopeptide repeat protein [Streptomyces virginiae]|uniref:tetratricopeptide repeat protein n=1 Tax=Streptomyces virginiae TaxID=1961 RepID=UPI00225BA0D1|nr:tetratricopeptide repeat protein [Streptomyces virginiae]MCX4719669.1 tetratricopeptide repeat protein [Streptomyces virginiae]
MKAPAGIEGRAAALLSSLVTPERRPAALGLAGAALMLLGAVLPWVVGADSDTLPYGFRPDADAGGPALGSRAGLAGGDALVVVLTGAAALWAAVLLLIGRGRGVHRAALIGAALLGGAWAALDLAETGTVPGRTGRLPDVSAGPGPYVVLAAVLLLLASGVLARWDPESQLYVRTERANRLWDNGRFGEALELQQRNVRSARRSPGRNHPSTTSASVALVWMYAWGGWPDRAAELARQTFEDAAHWAPEHPEDYQRLRADIAAILGR